ncbi:MAG: o-succinylbenzoate--CoA ligase [Solirubrobacterales bacterium]
MVIANWLAARAVSCPERVAVVADGAELTYAELEDRARAAAIALADEGIGRDTVVGLRMPAGADLVVTVHALMKLGAVALPLDPSRPEADQARALAQVEPRLVLTELPAGGHDTAALAPDDRLLADLETDAAFCHILTSGTSGTPRPVTLTYGNVLWSAIGSAFVLGVDPADRWLCCLPLHHVSGLSILVRSVIYGTGAVVQDGFDAAQVARALREDGVTVTSLVPTQLDRLLDGGAQLGNARVNLVGGGPLSARSLERAQAEGVTAAQTYGLTEAASQVTTLAAADGERKVGSAGRPLLGTEVRIEADGEISARGPTIARDVAAADGWLRTGDRGRLDDEGFLYVEGRIDDLIVTGGENVDPVEVESVLAEHPEVAEAAVFGREDAEWGQAVTALVVPPAGCRPSEDGLRSHCLSHLASFKVPKGFRLVSELPRTATGKLRRRDLR